MKQQIPDHLLALYPPSVRGANLFDLDLEAQDLLARLLPDYERWRPVLADFGAFVGDEVDAEAAYTDRHGLPRLEAYDRDGRLVNRIVHNPAWEAVSAEVYRRGMVGLNHAPDAGQRAPYALTFAMGYQLSQADLSLHCPVTMTGAVAHVLAHFAPAPVRDLYLHDLIRRDGRALSGGTWATELHGGSDVGATTTRVTRRASDLWPAGVTTMVLNGLKWFTSNANGGLALATARPEGAPSGTRGLGLYLVPTHLPDGAPNPMRIRRLKDKLGTRGVPTGEIDLIDTWAVEVAPPPRGFLLMMEALQFSRIHNAMGALGLQRRALMEATGFALRREAFRHPIAHYPMVQDEILAILAPLAAGLALGFEAARAFDDAAAVDPEDNEHPARVWMRLLTALAKYATAEDAVAAARRAIEIIGGNGYTEDWITPRLLRDAQVTTVWEGPANIQALELLRLLDARSPALPLLRDRLDGIVTALPRPLGPLARILTEAGEDLFEAVLLLRTDAAEAPRHARRLLALMADVVMAALLAEQAGRDAAGGDLRRAMLARLFAEARLAPPGRRGILPGRDEVERHFDALLGHQPVRRFQDMRQGVA